MSENLSIVAALITGIGATAGAARMLWTAFQKRTDEEIAYLRKLIDRLQNAVDEQPKAVIALAVKIDQAGEQTLNAVSEIVRQHAGLVEKHIALLMRREHE